LRGIPVHSPQPVLCSVCYNEESSRPWQWLQEGAAFSEQRKQSTHPNETGVNVLSSRNLGGHPQRHASGRVVSKLGSQREGGVGWGSSSPRYASEVELLGLRCTAPVWVGQQGSLGLGVRAGEMKPGLTPSDVQESIRKCYASCERQPGTSGGSDSLVRSVNLVGPKPIRCRRRVALHRA